MGWRSWWSAPKVRCAWTTRTNCGACGAQTIPAVSGKPIRVRQTPANLAELPNQSPFTVGSLYLAQTLAMSLPMGEVLLDEAASFYDGLVVQRALDAARAAHQNGDMGANFDKAGTRPHNVRVASHPVKVHSIPIKLRRQSMQRMLRVSILLGCWRALLVVAACAPPPPPPHAAAPAADSGAAAGAAAASGGCRRHCYRCRQHRTERALHTPGPVV